MIDTAAYSTVCVATCITMGVAMGAATIGSDSDTCIATGVDITRNLDEGYANYFGAFENLDYGYATATLPCPVRA